MPPITRPNGSNYFATLPGIDPDIGAAIDDELNEIVAAANALDNSNIADSPKIAGDKVDLSEAGFLPETGGALSDTLIHNFDGIFRLMRASGNGRIREYRGSDGAIWGISYNTYWNGSAWAGRDTTDICLALKLESDGLHLYYAASGAAGSAPAWVEIFHVTETGLLAQDNCISTNNLNDGIVLPEHEGTGGVGDVLWMSADTENNSDLGSYTKVKEIQLAKTGAIRVKFDIATGGAGGVTAYGKIYINGVAAGQERTVGNNTYVTFTEDFDVVIGDKVQLYMHNSGSGSSSKRRNFRIYTSVDHNISTAVLLDT